MYFIKNKLLDRLKFDPSDLIKVIPKMYILIVLHCFVNLPDNSRVASFIKPFYLFDKHIWNPLIELAYC